MDYWTVRSSRYQVNLEGEVILCELEGDIKLDKEGKNHIVNYLTTTLTLLSDVATYTVLIGVLIKYCSVTRRNVCVYEVQQVDGPGHREVAVVRNEVMLCEFGNKGTITRTLVATVIYNCYRLLKSLL